MYDTLVDQLEEYIEYFTTFFFFHIPAPIAVYYFVLTSSEQSAVSWWAFPIIALTTPTIMSLLVERHVLPILIIAPLLYLAGYMGLGSEFSSFYWLAMKYIGMGALAIFAVYVGYQAYLFIAWLIKKILSYTIFYNWFTMLLSAIAMYHLGSYVFNTYEDTINLILLFAVPFVLLILFITGSPDMPELSLRTQLRREELMGKGESYQTAKDISEIEAIHRQNKKDRNK